LPKEGDVLTLKSLRKLREELSFSDAEIAEFSIVSTPEQITWNEVASKDAVKAVEIGPKLHLTIADALKTLSESGKLVDMQLDLYDKFVAE